jgi:hypothetical protein
MRRLLPRRHWNEEGVASTVGTIMALLVFLTFLSLITNQYVPVWMKDSEAGHMGEALGQFGDFKSDIDTQILGARVAQQMRSHFIPYTAFATVKLGVDGVPIFSSPTLGELRVNQTNAPWTVWFRYSISGNNTTVPEATCPASLCGGHVRLNVFNRYFPRQEIAYENGALIRAQSDGQLVKGATSFQVLVANSSVQVDFALIQLFGSGGVVGVGSEGLQSRVLSVDLQEYKKVKTDIIVNHTSLYGPAWYRFFNDTLADAYGITSDDYDSNQDFDFTVLFDGYGRAIQLRTDNPIYVVQSLWNPAKENYNVTLRFKLDVGGDSVSVLPVTAFRLLHAYVNVDAGERGSEVGI